MISMSPSSSRSSAKGAGLSRCITTGAANVLPSSRLAGKSSAWVGVQGLAAAGEFLPGLFVGYRRRDDDVLAGPPVHRRRDGVPGGELAGIEQAQHLVEIAAGAHRIGQHRLDLLVRPDDEDRAHG